MELELKNGKKIDLENEIDYNVNMDGDGYELFSEVAEKYGIKPDDIKSVNGVKMDAHWVNFNNISIKNNYDGFRIGIDDGSCDGFADEYVAFLKENHPEIEVELFENQTGGSYVIDADGEPYYFENQFWEEFCNS